MMTIEQALEELRFRDEFKMIIEYLREEREQYLINMRNCKTSSLVMQLSGGVISLTDTITFLEGK